MAKTPKPAPEVVTFKVQESLLEMLRGIPNRSEFIRTALLAALDNLCPLCRGTGMLTPEKKRHWTEFSRDHNAQDCGTCQQLTIMCQKE